MLAALAISNRIILLMFHNYIIMKKFMLIISIIAWLDAIATFFIINTECPPMQTPLNVFFGVITAFITWIIIFQVNDMRKA